MLSLWKLQVLGCNLSFCVELDVGGNLHVWSLNPMLQWFSAVVRLGFLQLELDPQA